MMVGRGLCSVERIDNGYMVYYTEVKKREEVPPPPPGSIDEMREEIGEDVLKELGGRPSKLRSIQHRVYAADKKDVLAAVEKALEARVFDETSIYDCGEYLSADPA